MTEGGKYIVIRFDEMRSVFKRILVSYGFDDARAEKCAGIFAVNTLEGVFSHGINRFPRFVSNIRDGYIVPENEPVLIHRSHAIEQWDGMLGPGPLNAIHATDRAVELASEYGLGLVGLSNTNHWMRGGTYGWHAARKGFILICWTNTEANMPAWGAVDPRLGNNPFIIAVPFEQEAVVLDFAMTQYSYGKMETYQLNGETLPFPGGFDKSGSLSRDPAVILETRRTLPVGFWKGSGLSLMLDILAVVLTGGRSVSEITRSGTEHAVSQVFIAVNPGRLGNYLSLESSVREVISDLRLSLPVSASEPVRYPGESIIRNRERYLREGISVNRQLWEKILSL